MTFEQYIEDHSSSQMRAYLTGYADAIHNNAYFFGGCPKRFQYRPYNEYMQHIDIYIAQKTKDDNTNREIFLQKSVEPFLMEVILKYIDCDNPEAIQLQDQPKSVQIEVRDIARETMQKTNKYQTIDEREMEFQYNEYLKRLKNPTKSEKESKILHASDLKKKKNVSKPIAEKLKEQAEQKVVQEIPQEEQEEGIIDSVKDSMKDIANGVFSKFSSTKEEKPEKKPTQPTEKPSDSTPKKAEAVKIEKEPEPIKTTQTTQESKPSIEKPKIDLSVPELEIPKNVSGKSKTPKIEPATPKAEYKLDAMDINLDTLNNAKLPSI